jgi:class 3 adenylate cyclase
MKRRFPNLLLVGILLGLAYWMLESALHAYVFDSGTLRETLICERDPNELWMRMLLTVLLTAFGWAAERLVRAERHDKERAMKLNRLFKYVHEVSRLAAVKSDAPLAQNAKTALVNVDDSLLDESEMGQIVHALQDLSRYVDTRFQGLYALLELTHEINKGLFVDDLFGKIYDTFSSVIPYDRIGIALLEDNGRMLSARWARSDGGEAHITRGYRASMEGSSLLRILETGDPRIINDLSAYRSEHPHSDSSRLIVDEGIRSSLTCPLIAAGRPLGFIFFSSRQTGTYRNLHSDVFKLIAGQLSVVLEKSHIYEQLMAEMEKSESLLLNVMPARIIARIKAGNDNPVEELAEVGVLFADIAGFTEIAGHFSAESVVRFLRETFTQFDILCERHGVEKIKTIGDAYMACSGVSSPDRNGLLSLARFALEMLTTAAQLRCPDGEPLRLRIGIHSGPVIAGVIGQKKFAYDMWGDTVNVAQRLESTGMPGHVHVTEAVYAQLKQHFSFEPRGTIELKGKGGMTTYFIKEEVR